MLDALDHYIISTHALREEGDLGTKASGTIVKLFLPTPSARRATLCRSGAMHESGTFLPTPSARRATVELFFLCCHEVKISTHALREEGDYMGIPTGIEGISVFLPTPSARRATPV